MSRTFLDSDLLSWEAYASTGRYGLPDRPKIVFNCLTLPDVRARYVIFQGDQAGAEEAVSEMPEERLRELFQSSRLLT